MIVQSENKNLQGHLDQLLSEKFGYKVLGLEAQGSVVKTAKLKHQSKNVNHKDTAKFCIQQ